MDLNTQEVSVLLVENLLLKQFKEIIEESASINSSTSFAELGVNSMDVLQFIGLLQENFPNLPLTIFLECGNIKELGEYLTKHYPNQISIYLKGVHHD